MHAIADIQKLSLGQWLHGGRIPDSYAHSFVRCHSNRTRNGNHAAVWGQNDPFDLSHASIELPNLFLAEYIPEAHHAVCAGGHQDWIKRVKYKTGNGGAHRCWILRQLERPVFLAGCGVPHLDIPHEICHGEKSILMGERKVVRNVAQSSKQTRSSPRDIPD